MSFGAYLVGTFEKRLGILTQFQVVNTTARQVELLAVFVDRTGTVIICERARLNPNALWERDTAQLAEALRPEAGVAKFFSLVDETPEPAIVGFQRRAAAGPFGGVNYAAFGESNLAAIPLEVATTDYQFIKPQCP